VDDVRSEDLATAIAKSGHLLLRIQGREPESDFYFARALKIDSTNIEGMLG
jgi:hypothetical protein